MVLGRLVVKTSQLRVVRGKLVSKTTPLGIVLSESVYKTKELRTLIYGLSPQKVLKSRQTQGVDYLTITAKWTTDLNSDIYKHALNIRQEVFIDEQGVDVDLEIDELEEQTEHIVLFQNEAPIAVARIYDLGDGVYKVQRVATLKTYRGQGHGARLMKEIELKIAELGGTNITLGAQNTALPFYEKLGYTIEGDQFMDAGIPHHTMTKNIPSN